MDRGRSERRATTRRVRGELGASVRRAKATDQAKLFFIAGFEGSGDQGFGDGSSQSAERLRGGSFAKCKGRRGGCSPAGKCRCSEGGSSPEIRGGSWARSPLGYILIVYTYIHTSVTRASLALASVLC